MFHVLKNSAVTGSLFETEFVKEGPVNTGDAPRCEACGGYVGMLAWLPPYRVELELWGKDSGDVVFGTSADFLVSERLSRLFEAEGLVGLEGFDPVEIVRVRRHKKHGQKPPAYLHVTVRRGGAAVDDERSGIVRSGPITCPVCLSQDADRAARVVIDPSEWAGEDLFIPRGLYGFIAASERFKEFCKQHDIRNAVLIPAEEYSFDFYAK